LKRSATPWVWGCWTKAKLSGDPPVLDLVLEVVGEGLGAMIHAQGQAASHLRGDGAVEAGEPLSDGL
jgi:hypothetical protein